MKTHSSPVVARRRLAAELKKAREERGETGGEVAKALDWSSSRISRIEKAQVGIPLEDVETLARRYDIAEPLRGALIELATESMGKAWWDAYGDVLPESYATFIGLEAGASVERSWQISVVPGLLQTPQYAAEIMSIDSLLEVHPPSVIRRRADVRMRRQGLLTAETSLRLDAVISESVLRHMYGTRQVLRDQLHHLLKMAELPTVSIRVHPFSAVRTTALTNFVLLEFPNVGEPLHRLHPDVLYQENAAGASFNEDEQTSFGYLRTFERFADGVLDERDSLKLIAAAADRLV